MRHIFKVLAVAAVLATGGLVATATQADAHPYGRHGHHHNYGYRPHVVPNRVVRPWGYRNQFGGFYGNNNWNGARWGVRPFNNGWYRR